MAVVCKNTEEIITGTFQSSVFSIQYNKNFAVLIDSSGKVKSLLSKFDLIDRICTAESLNSVLERKINYTSVNAIKNKKILSSKKWLFDCVEGKNEARISRQGCLFFLWCLHC